MAGYSWVNHPSRRPGCSRCRAPGWAVVLPRKWWISQCLSVSNGPRRSLRNSALTEDRPLPPSNLVEHGCLQRDSARSARVRFSRRRHADNSFFTVALSVGCVASWSASSEIVATSCWMPLSARLSRHARSAAEASGATVSRARRTCSSRSVTEGVVYRRSISRCSARLAVAALVRHRTLQYFLGCPGPMGRANVVPHSGQAQVISTNLPIPQKLLALRYCCCSDELTVSECADIAEVRHDLAT